MTTTVRKVVAVVLGGVIGIVYGVTDADLQRDADSDARATQNPTQQPTGDSGTSRQETTQAPEDQGLVLESAGVCSNKQTCSAPPGGVEPPFSD